MQNCEAAGNGDSGLYPGAGADTGQPARHEHLPGVPLQPGDPLLRLAPQRQRLLRAPTATPPTSHHNNFYDNALGFTTDVFTAPGHPGFPQDSDLIENNNFYSNNFNPYVPGSDVVPTVPVPVGTGLWIAGGNDNVVRNNHFYDNWRRGTMVFAVPDQVVCGPAGIDPTQLAGCNPTAVPPSTSYRNQFYGNVMGRSPDGTRQAQRHRGRHDRPHRLLVGPVPRATPATAGTTTPARTARRERHEHAAGAAAAIRVRQLEHRHDRPAAGAGAAQLPRGHRVRHVHLSVVHDAVEAVDRLHRRKPRTAARADLLSRAARQAAEDSSSSNDEPAASRTSRGAGHRPSGRCAPPTAATGRGARSISGAAPSSGSASSRAVRSGPRRASRPDPCWTTTRLQGAPELLRELLRARLQALQALRARGGLRRPLTECLIT